MHPPVTLAVSYRAAVKVPLALKKKKEDKKKLVASLKMLCIGGENMSEYYLGHFGPFRWWRKNSLEKNCRKMAKIIKIA